MKKNLVKILIAGLIFFLFFIFIFRSCQSDIKDIKEKKYKEKAEAKVVPEPQDKYSYRTIEYKGEYSTIYIPSGCRFAFIDPTEPYCCINDNKHIECGQKGQDISAQMGDSNANTVLKIRSSNGKNGKLTLRTRNK